MNQAITNTPKAEPHLPGEVGVWMFILGDMLIFSLFFGVFFFYRAHDIDLYMASQASLNQKYGVINTLLLLTSSLFVVLALQSARHRLQKYGVRFLQLAFLCGLGFAVVKFIEYGGKINHGITLVTNEFFMFYYILTGIHFLHVLIGMGVLTFMIFKCGNSAFQESDVFILESGASYWHMVDLLWIVLFPLLYLMR